jgi:hypothetical protein
MVSVSSANQAREFAERKLRRRQLTEDGNVEITARDLRETSAAATRSVAMTALD